MPKLYDREYFDKWYRHPDHAVSSKRELERKVALAVAATEYFLGRPIVNVLDVGCGEAVWRAPLLKLRPNVEYLGLDSSEYVVRHYGRSRNVRLATFGDLSELRFDRDFDLIVCSDTIHYVRNAELRRGLRGIVEMLDGVAFLELFTSKDAPEGDKLGFIPRSPRWYLKEFEAAGLTPVGTHCYLGPKLKGRVAELELPRRH